MPTPTKRTQQVVEQILARIAAGEPLTRICRSDEKFPCPSVFRDWCDADEALAIAYARAREIGFDAIAEEALDIADDGSNDFIEKTRNDGSTYEAFDAEHVQRSKLRVETRLKLLAKWDPKRFGDKLDLTSGGEKLAGDISPEEKFARLHALATRAQDGSADVTG